MKWYTTVLLLMACVIAGLLGAILYNYLSLSVAEKQLAQLEADARIIQELNEPLEKEVQEVKRKQVIPSRPIEGRPVPADKRTPIADIIYKIRQNWVTTDDMRGKSCRVTFNLSPTGNIESLKILEGDTLVCRSTVKAIHQSAPFDMPSDPLLYQSVKTLTAVFGPQFY